jgi:hypothetical protein
MSVGAAFLDPYGLNADKSTVTANGTAGPVHTALQQLPDIAAYTYQGSYDKWTTDNLPRWVAWVLSDAVLETYLCVSVGLFLIAASDTACYRGRSIAGCNMTVQQTNGVIVVLPVTPHVTQCKVNCFANAARLQYVRLR